LLKVNALDISGCHS